MFNLITKCWPPRPPQATAMTVGGTNIDTYGSPLDRNEFNTTDVQLRTMVKRCMAHDPADRPSLRELQQVAKGKVGNNAIPGDPTQESNAAVQAWVNTFIHSANIWV